MMWQTFGQNLANGGQNRVNATPSSQKLVWPVFIPPKTDLAWFQPIREAFDSLFLNAVWLDPFLAKKAPGKSVFGPLPSFE